MSTHRRTWQQHHVGHALITVELEPGDAELNVERHRRIVDLTKKLVDVFTAERLPVTWAVGDPARSPACPPILRASAEHEIAILGNDTWLGQQAGRMRFARELAQRVTQARSAGFPVTSLVTRVAPPQAHVDLVVKYGVSAVAGVELHDGATYERPVPRAMHFGVWELPTSERLPIARSWLSSGQRSLLRRVRWAAQEAATFHIVIDAPALEHDARRSVSMLARLARRVAEFRDRGLLQVETAAQAAARLAAVPAVKPQRSILRMAA